MHFTHAYRSAISKVLSFEKSIHYIVSHSVEYSPYHQHNTVEVHWEVDGIEQYLKADTRSNLAYLHWVCPYPDVVYPWLKSRLFPESIHLGSKLAVRLYKQAKAVQEYSEAPHVVYGVARDPNGQLRTFFKPCNDEELQLHEKNTTSYIYAIH